jgi:large subunit ribosomal protein L10
MDGKVLGADDAKALADLESREVMLSKIAGLLKGEMSRAAAMFVQIQSKFLGVLEAYKEKVPGEPTPEVVQPTPEVEETEATEAIADAATEEPEPTDTDVQAQAPKEEE